jgi:hypothetical protein
MLRATRVRTLTGPQAAGSRDQRNDPAAFLLHTRLMNQQEPQLCRCGNVIRYSNDDRCEDCWVSDQQRWSGKSQRVNTTTPTDDKPEDKK